ncbi:MAG: 1-deoxy-D-xylulose-5-phosphate synthase N-terminal domain-containing protein, partial [Burkholderiaceae bacterium]
MPDKQPSTDLANASSQPLPRLLENVNFPQELRRLKRDQLPQLADELRQYILDSVSK